MDEITYEGQFPVPPFDVVEFLRGCVREALAASHSLALIGRQETRWWEYQNRYVVDDGEGNCGVIQIAENDCVGAISKHDSPRLFDCILAAKEAPPSLQGPLVNTCELPIFQGPYSRVTAILWSDRGQLTGPEAWVDTYSNGADVFQHELLDDRSWVVAACDYHDISRDLALKISVIAARWRMRSEAISLSTDEASWLLPEHAPHRTEALHDLTASGVFKLG